MSKKRFAGALVQTLSLLAVQAPGADAQLMPNGQLPPTPMYQPYTPPPPADPAIQCELATAAAMIGKGLSNYLTRSTISETEILKTSADRIIVRDCSAEFIQAGIRLDTPENRNALLAVGEMPVIRAFFGVHSGLYQTDGTPVFTVWQVTCKLGEKRPGAFAKSFSDYLIVRSPNGNFGPSNIPPIALARFGYGDCD